MCVLWDAWCVVSAEGVVDGVAEVPVVCGVDDVSAALGSGAVDVAGGDEGCPLFAELLVVVAVGVHVVDGCMLVCGLGKCGFRVVFVELFPFICARAFLWLRTYLCLFFS